MYFFNCIRYYRIYFAKRKLAVIFWNSINTILVK